MPRKLKNPPRPNLRRELVVLVARARLYLDGLPGVSVEAQECEKAATAINEYLAGKFKSLDIALGLQKPSLTSTKRNIQIATDVLMRKVAQELQETGKVEFVEPIPTMDQLTAKHGMAESSLREHAAKHRQAAVDDIVATLLARLAAKD